MKTLLAVCLALAACASGPKPPIGSTPPGGSPGTGTLTGTVHSVGVPCPEPKPGCDGPAANHEVIIYKADGTTEAARVTTKADGTFETSLPEGDYVILMPGSDPNLPGARHEIHIGRDALSKIDLRLDTGVRAEPAPAP